MKDFKADKVKISDILDRKDIFYSIPLYQREYSWENEYVENFWNYLVDSDNNYFLGTIVFNAEFISKGYKEIVDGQQRMITITIFLAILRNIFFELRDDARANGIHEDNIANINRDKEDIGYKISVGTKLKLFFEKNIQSKKGNIIDSEGLTKEEKRVKKNYQLLEIRIREFIGIDSTNEEKISKLRELRDKILGLELVYIEVQDEEDAYTFFETINATGMKLSTADVLKNLIFKNSEFSVDYVNTKWDNILENLKNKDEQFDITRFIRHYWLSKHKKVTDRKLYGSIKEALRSKTYYKNYDDLINQLEGSSLHYNTILYPNENDFDGISKSIYTFLKRLQSLRAIQTYPAILSLLELMSRKDFFEKINSKKAIFLINRIEHFIFVYTTIVGKSPSPLESLFSDIGISLSKVRTREDFELSIDKGLSSIDKLMPKKEEFIVNLRSLNYKNNEKQLDIIKYFFDKINNTTGENKFNNINIEHIFPQNPEDINNDIGEIVHNIGNLTILGPTFNRKASNKLPIDKTKYYAESKIGHTQEIGLFIEGNEGWGIKDINDRSMILAETAWGIFSKF